MTDFLAQASLATDQDTDNSTGECVTLMTVHAAKGLEYKNVIIVGVEEDLFPSIMSKNSLAQIEEERRLLYVAITRAEKNCIITFAKSRFRNGNHVNCKPSRFIYDIDEQYLSMGSTSAKKTKVESDTSNEWHNARNEKRQSFHAHDYSSTSHSTPPTSRFKPISSAKPSSPVTNSGDFGLHTIDEVNEGAHIIHSVFGNGTIVRIDTSGSDAKIIAEFDVMGQRTLLLKFAKFKIC